MENILCKSNIDFNRKEIAASSISSSEVIKASHTPSCKEENSGRGV